MTIDSWSANGGFGLVSGEPGEVAAIGPEWLGWSGKLAHPDSPAGGGGPGCFRQPGPQLGGSVTVGTERLGTEAKLQELSGTQPPAQRRPSPPTHPRSLGTLKSVRSNVLDVLVTAELLADGTGASAATSFKLGSGWSSPGYSMNSEKRITRFASKFVWRTKITLQTVYAAANAAEQVSCYGRGTTPEDIRNGNTTLGFHESCHRRDFISYLAERPLPDPPNLKLGMTEASYKSQLKNLDAQVKKYFEVMEAESEASTDEVGHPRTVWKRTGKCFVHLSL